MTMETPPPEEEESPSTESSEGAEPQESTEGTEKPKTKISETIESLKKSEKVDSLYSYAKSNTVDTIAYIALILGIVWLFFDQFYGGLLVGVVFGLYFAEEMSHIIKNANDLIEEQGMVRSLVLGGTILAFFISTAGIFIGAAVVVGLKQLVIPGSSSKD